MNHSKVSHSASPNSSLERAWNIHAGIMTAGTLAFVLCSGSISELSTTNQVIILALCVAILAVPHGALDHLVARPFLRHRFGKAWLPLFFICYLICACFVLWAWYAASVVTLLVFLAASVYHFGSGDVVFARYETLWERIWLIVWRGFIVISIPIIRHTDDTIRIFAVLLHGIAVDWLLILVQPTRGFIFWSLIILAVGSTVIALRPISKSQQWARCWDAFESVAIALLFWVAPPLLAFLVYFCGWHSLRHTLQTANQLADGYMPEGFRKFAVQSLPLTLVTLILATIAYPVLTALPTGTSMDTTSGVLRLVFYGLSALTLPHMIVIFLSTLPRNGSNANSILHVNKKAGFSKC